MGKLGEDIFIQDGEWSDKRLRGAFHQWLDRDWMVDDIVEHTIKVSDDNDYRFVAFKDFESWINSVIEDDWWELKRDYGVKYPKKVFAEYVDSNDEFREGVEDHVEYVTADKGDADPGNGNEADENGDGDDEDDEDKSYRYGDVQRLGIMEDVYTVNWGKVKGTMLKFVKEVDEIKGTSKTFDLDYVMQAWNRWMLNKFGNNWVKATTIHIKKDDVRDCISSLYEDNTEFRGLVESKYEYDGDELEGNTDPDDEGKVTFGGQTYDKTDSLDNDNGKSNTKSKTGLSRYEDVQSGSSGNGDDGKEDGERQPQKASVGSRDRINYRKWVGKSGSRDDELKTDDLYIGNCWNVLDRMPRASVDVIVTSPPYWALRDYDDQEYTPMCGDPDCDHTIAQGECYHCGAWAGQLGHEPNKEMFIRDLVAILEKARSVLKGTGHLFLNIGDTYDDKSAQMVPERVYSEMIDEGWNLRDKIVWAKKVWMSDDTLVGNGKPSPHEGRLAPQWEPMYHFTKSKDYWSDIDSNRLMPTSFEGDMGKATEDSKFEEGEDSRRGRQYNPLGTNPSDVWQINTDGREGEHTAVFPQELVKRCIEIATPERVCEVCGRPFRKENVVENEDTVVPGGDDVVWTKECSCTGGFDPGVVMDIFMGSGTTAVSASEAGYRWTGIEVSEKYAEEAKSRIPSGRQMKLGK